MEWCFRRSLQSLEQFHSKCIWLEEVTIHYHRKWIEWWKEKSRQSRDAVLFESAHDAIVFEPVVKSHSCNVSQPDWMLFVACFSLSVFRALNSWLEFQTNDFFLLSKPEMVYWYVWPRPVDTVSESMQNWFCYFRSATHTCLYSTSIFQTLFPSQIKNWKPFFVSHSYTHFIFRRFCFLMDD